MGKSEKAKSAAQRLKAFFDRLKSSFVKLGKGVVNAVYPESIVCIGCGAELGGSDSARFSLCNKCIEKLPFRTVKTCEKCGAEIQSGNICKNCMVAELKADKIIAPYFYDGFIRSVIISYKDSGKTYLYKYTARFLADYFIGTDVTADFVCYVPSDSGSSKIRGFDHMRKLAEEFAAITGIPLLKPLCRKDRKKDQTEFNRSERFVNVANAFYIAPSFDVTQIAGKRALLLDDVVTTGATASECAGVLKDKAAVAYITVLALAR